MGLIARAGLDAVTVRDVADGAGCSTAIVSHYFRNKKELLLLTYRATIDRATERGALALAADKNDLRAFLAEIMPLDEERLTEWKVWLAFWAKATSDPEIAEMQRTCVVVMRERIVAILDRLHERGELAPGLDRIHAARHLLATITGMAIEAMFDPGDWPNERQHDLIDPDLRAIYRADRAPRFLAAQPSANIAAAGG